MRRCELIDPEGGQGFVHLFGHTLTWKRTNCFLVWVDAKCGSISGEVHVRLGCAVRGIVPTLTVPVLLIQQDGFVQGNH